MKTRLWFWATICVAVVAGTSVLPAAEGQPPNIVIFLVDNTGVMDASVPFLTDAAGQPKQPDHFAGGT